VKSIVFHNWGRKGDIHVSRSFVRAFSQWAQKHEVACQYHHAEPASILSDLPYVEHVQCSQTKNQPRSYTSSELRGGRLLINTWYGAGEHAYASKEDDDLISLDTLYRLFNDASKKFLGFPLSSLGNHRSFVPRIDWKAFPATLTARDRIQARPKTKRVFVDTVKCLSGQAHNFPLVPVVRNAAIRQPDVDFYYTFAGPFARESMPPNAIWTRNVHGIKEGLDLTENAYISTLCDVIVGRASSSYTFALCSDNILSSKRFLEFSLLHCPVIIGPMLKPLLKAPCHITQSPTTSRDEALDLLLREIAAT